MDILQQSILKTLAYYDIFNHPLTAAEIKMFMDKPCSDLQLNGALAELAKEKVIFKTKEFYQLKYDDSLTSERLKANKAAEKQLQKAEKIADFLSSFPFIKGIAVSGSLSKKTATSKSDYDFFIITKANRLWLCRSFFSIFIRFVSLFGYRKYFCLNYIIDETYLEVEEKNIFTATEIVTLLPMYGADVFAAFFSANKWVYDFFPNMSFIEHTIKYQNKNLFKRSTEWLLNNFFGNKADDSIMHYFNRRWKKMMMKNKLTESGFLLGAMMVDKHYCRHYPQHFQRRVLLKHEEKITNLTAAILESMQRGNHFLSNVIIK